MTNEPMTNASSVLIGIWSLVIGVCSPLFLRAQEVAAKDRARAVYVYSDSQYSIGLLTKPWKAKKNVELVAELRELVRQFPRLTFVKVAGHSGIPLNERTDELARDAIVRRS